MFHHVVKSNKRDREREKGRKPNGPIRIEKGCQVAQSQNSIYRATGPGSSFEGER